MCMQLPICTLQHYSKFHLLLFNYVETTNDIASTILAPGAQSVQVVSIVHVKNCLYYIDMNIYMCKNYIRFTSARGRGLEPPVSKAYNPRQIA